MESETNGLVQVAFVGVSPIEGESQSYAIRNRLAIKYMDPAHLNVAKVIKLNEAIYRVVDTVLYVSTVESIEPRLAVFLLEDIHASVVKNAVEVKFPA